MKSRPMLKHLRCTLPMVVATAFAAPLHAEGPVSKAQVAPSPTFQKLDVNRDGYVSREEVAGLRDFLKAFNEADDNRDGRLSPDEFLKAQAIYDRLRAAAYVDDSVITVKVKAALVKDPDVKALEVSVETSDGIVLLSGFVESEKQARRARELAGLVDGVKSVRSNLVVKG